jgi:hypothetical protein
MRSRTSPPDSVHDNVAPASDREVIIDLAHTVIRNLQEENAQLVDENDRLRHRLELTGALLRPADCVLQ